MTKKIKLLIIILSAVFMVAGAAVLGVALFDKKSAKAADGYYYYNNIEYYYYEHYSEGYVATVNDLEDEFMGSLSFLSSFSVDGITYKVNRLTAWLGYCKGVTSITLPTYLVEYNPSELGTDCPALTSLSISTSNSYFYTTNGVLYNKNRTELLFYPPAKTGTSFSIPSTVTKIAENAFQNTTFLETVTCTSSMTEIGSYAFSACYSLKSVVLPSNLTKINDNAFYFCYNLNSITFPSTLTEIGSFAFGYCRKLSNFTLPENIVKLGVGAFYMCTNLTSVTIPAKVSDLGGGVFAACSNLDTIVLNNTNYYTMENNVVYNVAKTILVWYPASKTDSSFVVPNTVTEISKYAFNCNNYLNNVSMPTNLNILGSYAFYNCNNLLNLSIPEGVNKIDSYTFYDCSGLISIDIPQSVTSIGSSAFNGCKNLKNIDIPSNVNVIESSAFSGCSNLESIVLPNGITSIEGSVFSECVSLESVSMPESLTTIGISAFYKCSSLKSIEIPINVININAQAFYGCSLLDEIYFQAVSMNDLSSNSGIFNKVGEYTEGVKLYIDSNVEKIPNYLFYGYGDGGFYLIEVIFEEGSKCVSIGNNSFRECANLKKISLPQSMTSIGSYAFYGCTNLQSFDILDSITSVGSNAFNYCENMEKLYIGRGITKFENNSFSNCTGLTEIQFNANILDLSNSSRIFDKAGRNGNGINVKFGANVTRIPAYLFYPYSISDYANIVSVSFAEGSNCASIGQYAFCNLSNLNVIEIPQGLTSIEQYAFSKCNSLVNIVLPNSLNNIGNYAFNNCIGLTRLVLPSGLINLGNSTFRSCEALEQVIFLQTSNITMSSYCFRYGLSTAIYYFANQAVMDSVKSSYGTTNYFSSLDFRLLSNSVNLTINHNNGGVVSGAGVYEGGTLARLIAIPFGGYEFIGWKDNNGNLISGNKKYSFVMNSSTSIVADFVKKVNLVFETNNEEYGKVNVTKLEGKPELVSAIANPGYEFLYWITDTGEHILENPLTQFIEGVTTYTAVFGKPMEPNSVCVIDSMLVTDVNNSTFEVTKSIETNLDVMGSVSIINYTSKTDLSMVHVWVSPNVGYEFVCWAVVDESGALKALNKNGMFYQDVADIDVSQIKDKVLIACFRAI